VRDARLDHLDIEPDAAVIPAEVWATAVEIGHVCTLEYSLLWNAWACPECRHVVTDEQLERARDAGPVEPPAPLAPARGGG